MINNLSTPDSNKKTTSECYGINMETGGRTNTKKVFRGNIADAKKQQTEPPETAEEAIQRLQAEINKGLEQEAKPRTWGDIMYILFSLIPCALLIIGTAEMPNEYYIFLRISVFIYCGFYAYISYAHELFKDVFKKLLTFIFGTIALLFNPFFKITLEKSEWVVIDIIVAIFIFAIGITFYASYKANAPKMEKP